MRHHILKCDEQSGFTLLEVILSLFIFSLIATSTLFALRIGLSAGDQLERSDRELRQLQITRLLIKEDLAQLLARPVRDEFGNQNPAAFVGGTIANNSNFNDEIRYLMRFTRGGWSNPDFEDPRPSVQYIEYLIRDDQLIRRARPFLDNAREQPFIERLLLDDVETVDLDFLTSYARGDPQWIETWPIPNVTNPTISEGAAALNVPRVVRLTMQSRRYGELSQLFWVGSFSRGGQS